APYPASRLGNVALVVSLPAERKGRPIGQKPVRRRVVIVWLGIATEGADIRMAVEDLRGHIQVVRIQPIVVVDDHDVVETAGGDARNKRIAASEAGLMDYSEIGSVDRPRTAGNFRRAVRRSVVDKNDLEWHSCRNCNGGKMAKRDRHAAGAVVATDNSR